MAESTASPGATGETLNILHVVLHGLICLIDDGEGYVAHLHEMGEDHKYLCGDFLAEEDLQRNADGSPLHLALEGIKYASGKKLDPDLNLIVNLPVLPPVKSGAVRAVIGLPYPYDIHYFIQGTLDFRSVEGDEACLAQRPSSISGVRVFEYRLKEKDSFRSVRVRGKHHFVLWECPEPATVCQNPLPDANVAVLHIYNEPPEAFPKPAAADHNMGEFNLTLGFLGASLRLKAAAKVSPKNSKLPIGLFWPEVRSLDTRQEFVNSLTRHLREWQSCHETSRLEKDLTELLAQPVQEGGGSGSQVCVGANGQLG